MALISRPSGAAALKHSENAVLDCQQPGVDTEEYHRDAQRPAHVVAPRNCAISLAPLAGPSPKRLQHPQRAQRVPAAGLAGGLHVEVHLASMFGLQRPGAVLAAFLQQDIQRVLHAGIVARAGAPEVVQRPQDVVEPARGVGQHQETGVDDWPVRSERNRRCCRMNSRARWAMASSSAAR